MSNLNQMKENQMIKSLGGGQGGTESIGAFQPLDRVQPLTAANENLRRPEGLLSNLFASLLTFIGQRLVEAERTGQ